MDSTSEAVRALKKTEATLRDLLAAAARDGDYPAVLKLASWAKAVHELIADGIHIDSSTSEKSSLAAASSSAIHFPKSVQPLGKKDRKYPIFARVNDELILFGWSKRERKEYRHKVSHFVLKSLVKAIIEQGAEGRVFTTDELLPVRSITDGKEIPNYKAYVGISFLKHTGLIEQHGRSGYSIVRSNEFEITTEKLWTQLPIAQ